jgi:hypothetical protein
MIRKVTIGKGFCRSISYWMANKMIKSMHVFEFSIERIKGLNAMLSLVFQPLIILSELYKNLHFSIFLYITRLEKSTRIYKSLQESTRVYIYLQNSARICIYLQFMELKIFKNLQKSSFVFKNLQFSLKICMNLQIPFHVRNHRKNMIVN